MNIVAGTAAIIGPIGDKHNQLYSNLFLILFIENKKIVA
jgi:hypothetical protein